MLPRTRIEFGTRTLPRQYSREATLFIRTGTVFFNEMSPGLRNITTTELRQIFARRLGHEGAKNNPFGP